MTKRWGQKVVPVVNPVTGETWYMIEYKTWHRRSDGHSEVVTRRYDYFWTPNKEHAERECRKARWEEQ